MDFKEFNDRVRDIEYGNSGPSYSAAFPALIRKVYLWMTFDWLSVASLLTA